MKVTDQRSDGLIYIGYWMISRKLNLYAAAFTFKHPTDRILLCLMDGAGNLFEDTMSEYSLTQVDNDLRLKDYQRNSSDLFSIGGKGAAFNNFVVVTNAALKLCDDITIFLGERPQTLCFKGV